MSALQCTCLMSCIHRSVRLHVKIHILILWHCHSQSQRTLKTRCTSLDTSQTRTLSFLGHIPSRELTYPTLGKGKSSSKWHFGGYVSSLEGTYHLFIPWRMMPRFFFYPTSDAVELPFELLISLCREFQLGAQEMLGALGFDVLPKSHRKKNVSRLKREFAYYLETVSTIYIHVLKWI